MLPQVFSIHSENMDEPGRGGTHTFIRQVLIREEETSRIKRQQNGYRTKEGRDTWQEKRDGR